MDYQRLKDNLKSDLRTISTLEMDIVPAKDYYGALLKAVLKSSLFMLAVNVVVQLWFKLVGSFRVEFSLGFLLGTWMITIGFSLVPVFFIRSFILFDKLIKSRLKSEAFMKEKFHLLVKIFFFVFTVSYIVIAIYDSHFIRGTIEIFNIFSIHIGACVMSLLITGFLVGIEGERLGIGMLIELVSAFSEKMQKATLFSSEEH